MYKLESLRLCLFVFQVSACRLIESCATHLDSPYFNQPLHVLKKGQKENRNLTIIEKAKKGFFLSKLGKNVKYIANPEILVRDKLRTCGYEGGKIFFSGLLGVVALNKASDMLKIPFNYQFSISMAQIIAIASLAEEIGFRGVLNNLAHIGQRALDTGTPSCLRGKLFAHITSPSSWMLGIHTLFSLAHGSLFPQIFTQFPALTALHETTGDIIAPMAYHLSNNILAGLVMGTLLKTSSVLDSFINSQG